MTKSFSLRPAEILLVEDNEGDAFITQQMFERSKIANNLHIVEDGTDALDFLRKQGAYADAPTPDIMLLDINLPKLDGKEVLRIAKEDEQLKYLPIIMLTSSKSEQDVVKSYGCHANGYMVKPVGLVQFQDTIQALNGFWLSIVVLPEEEEIRRVQQNKKMQAVV